MFELVGTRYVRVPVSFCRLGFFFYFGEKFFSSQDTLGN